MVRQKDKSASLKQVRKRSQLSCDRCRIHKRKCDREEPCGRCVKDNAECSFKKANVTKEHQDSSTRESSEHQSYNKALSVADIDVDAFIATALTKQIPKRWQKGGSSHFNQLIEAPFFLFRIFSLYINLVDWIGDLLRDTRIDRTIATHSCQPSREVAPILWEALEPLAYIVIAITAQMVPTEVEVILMDYSKDNSLYTADILAQEAFKLTVEIFSYPEWFQSTNEWPPEHFAAFMMIHVFQKNSGTIGFLDSSVIIAIEGLEKAGMHREPFVQRRGVRNDTIMEQERDLLIYRIFWSFYEKEHVRSWYSGRPARFKAEDYRICLRGEKSHISLNSLLSDSNTANTCMCATKTQIHLPVLSKFAFMQAKIGILIGRYYDLLASMSEKITYESTDVARYLVSDFDKEHFELGEEIADLNMRKYFRGGQSAMLQITLQHIRTGFRTKVCELYANKVFKDQYSISQQTINWMLEKRRNIAKIDLLEEGRKNCASWVATCRCSWIFTPKFMHDQLIDLIKAIEPWFIPMQDVGMPMQWLKVDDYNHLVNCFHAICQGRNTLVLMTRRSELQRVSRGVKEVCQLLHSFLMKSKVVQQGEEIASEILNSKELADLSQLQFSNLGPKCLNSSTAFDNESDTTHTMTTFSSSISTPITPLDVQMERDPSILSTLREINSNELQKALDAWDDDLDKIFCNSEIIPTIVPI